MTTSSTDRERILLVDDALNTLELLQRNLGSQGYQIFTASNVAEAAKFLETTSVDLVITDLRLPGASGLDLVRHVRENLKEAGVMMITGYATVEGAVEAVKTGAEEYLAKPFTEEELFSAVSRTLDRLRTRKTAQLPFHRSPRAPQGLIGNSEAMLGVFRAIPKAASTSATVLISGESGTGKELVARAIHYSSARASATFLPVSCGSIPEGLLESELFGYVKGAFTGATETRAGFFQTADGGTIFLDEISETSLPMQVKLLRVLQEREVYMIGTTRPRKVNVRILAATNKNLRDLIRKEIFRDDLFYRINVITIELPPLRDRGDDILLLTHHFTRKFAEELDKPVPAFTDDALQVLRNYDWPGNVRELENITQRLVVMTEGALIDIPDLPSLMRFSTRGIGLERTLAEVEAEYICNVLASVGDNKSLAARILGIDRKTLREKLKKARLD